MAQQYSAPPAMTLDDSKSYSATFKTNHGDIEIELFRSQAPVTVNNFVFLARDGFYNDVIIHRVIPGFMIQGGDPDGTGMGGPGYKFQDEFDTSLTFGTTGIWTKHWWKPVLHHRRADSPPEREAHHLWKGDQRPRYSRRHLQRGPGVREPSNRAHRHRTHRDTGVVGKEERLTAGRAPD